MAKRIGEALIEKGVITSAQLEAALKNQLILGGHLGTCLLELGFVGERELGQTLSEVLGIPYAPPALMRNVEERVVRAMPKRLVAEYRTVPIDLREHTLHVAMADPKNARALDVLAYGTGYRIAAWIAPEVRILEAMERVYDIPRTPRYIAIIRALERSEPGPSSDTSPSASTVFGETYISGSALETQSASFGAEFGYGRSWVEIAEELCETGSEAGVSAPAEPDVSPARQDESPATRTLSEVATRLCAADDKDQIAAAVLDFVSATVPRTLLLAIKDGEARVWRSHGFPVERSIRFKVEDAGVFDLLLGSDHYRGRLTDEPRHRRFYGILGCEFPSEIFLAPVHLNDRLVAVVVGDAGPRGRIEGETEDYLRVVRMLALSLSLLVLKKKIRAIESFASPVVPSSGPRIVVAGSEGSSRQPPPPRSRG